MWAWPGSCDHDNCTVQTAAMGQIPRSTERILVYRKRCDRENDVLRCSSWVGILCPVLFVH